MVFQYHGGILFIIAASVAEAVNQGIELWPESGR
jgi:hypothetical protein